jgi:hypothetical protein
LQRQKQEEREKQMQGQERGGGDIVRVVRGWVRELEVVVVEVVVVRELVVVVVVREVMVVVSSTGQSLRMGMAAWILTSEGTKKRNGGAVWGWVRELE